MSFGSTLEAAEAKCALGYSVLAFGALLLEGECTVERVVSAYSTQNVTTTIEICIT